MTSMNERSITIADALDWTQAVFADQVRQLLASDYLSILDLDRVLYAMGDFRIAMDLPAHRERAGPRRRDARRPRRADGRRHRVDLTPATPSDAGPTGRRRAPNPFGPEGPTHPQGERNGE